MNISLAIRQFFSMITILFGAGEKVAKSLDNLATVAEQTSQAYVDTATMEREVKLIEAKKRIEEAKAKALAIENKPKVIKA